MSPDLVLVDSSVWLMSLGKASSPEARKKVDKLLEENRVAITPMVTLEILGGARTEEDFGRLKRRMAALHQIPLRENDWEEAARISYYLRRRGNAIPYTDILIGVAAIKEQALLLHADRHFGIMAGGTGLLQENLLSSFR